MSGEGLLVSGGRGDTNEQGRHLGTSLCKSENVVDGQQHVLTLLITEVLGDGETGQNNTSTGTSSSIVHFPFGTANWSGTGSVEDRKNGRERQGSSGANKKERENCNEKGNGWNGEILENRFLLDVGFGLGLGTRRNGRDREECGMAG